MNKKFIILTSVLTSIFVFVLALVFALTFSTQKQTSSNVFHIKVTPIVVRDYNKNIIKTFPAPYSQVGGLLQL